MAHVRNCWAGGGRGLASLGEGKRQCYIAYDAQAQSIPFAESVVDEVPVGEDDYSFVCNVAKCIFNGLENAAPVDHMRWILASWRGRIALAARAKNG